MNDSVRCCLVSAAILIIRIILIILAIPKTSETSEVKWEVQVAPLSGYE